MVPIAWALASAHAGADRPFIVRAPRRGATRSTRNALHRSTFTRMRWSGSPAAEVLDAAAREASRGGNGDESRSASQMSFTFLYQCIGILGIMTP